DAAVLGQGDEMDMAKVVVKFAERAKEVALQAKEAAEQARLPERAKEVAEKTKVAARGLKARYDRLPPQAKLALGGTAGLARTVVLRRAGAAGPVAPAGVAAASPRPAATARLSRPAPRPAPALPPQSSPPGGLTQHMHDSAVQTEMMRGVLRSMGQDAIAM